MVTSSGRPEPSDSVDHRATIGWVLVGVQGLLLVALLVLPWRRPLESLWPPDVALVVGVIVLIAGLAIVVVGLLSLGSALTPTPVPMSDAALRTHGPYRYVRHPIYSGILLGGLGFVIAVGSWVQVVVWFVLLVFFVGKSTWEDHMLADRHGVRWYEYADRVGGLVPRVRPRR